MLEVWKEALEKHGVKCSITSEALCPAMPGYPVLRVDSDDHSAAEFISRTTEKVFGEWGGYQPLNPLGDGWPSLGKAHADHQPSEPGVVSLAWEQDVSSQGFGGSTNAPACFGLTFGVERLHIHLIGISYHCDLRRLMADRLGIDQYEGGKMAFSAMICLENVGRQCPTEFRLEEFVSACCSVEGPEVSPLHRRVHADLGVATEYGAAGIAELLAEDHLGLVSLARTYKGGTGFDYWMAPPDTRPSEDNFIGQATARLEVSGTCSKDRRELLDRSREKLKRLRDSNIAQSMPGYVVVVDFRYARIRIEAA